MNISPPPPPIIELATALVLPDGCKFDIKLHQVGWLHIQVVETTHIKLVEILDNQLASVNINSVDNLQHT